VERTTILSCFAPPEGFDGNFGWVCGFTANATVLEEMADRFTSGVRRRRSSLAVFLHPTSFHYPVLRGVSVPFWRPSANRSFNLLHAKVALLHFVGQQGSRLRLIVSTGNWTYDPMSTSLDMFWIVEWDEATPDRQAASDIRAAAAMFVWLRQLFDTSALEADWGHGTPENGLQRAVNRLPAKRLPPSRFLDTRKGSLQEQVLKGLAQAPRKRNRVLMGSGYFETGEQADSGVLSEFVRQLSERGFATARPRVDVILNHDACQGLAAQRPELEKLEWQFRRPFSRDLPGAKLHAKFIFSAGGSQNCSNPWCYIGSGNLSRVGFTRSVRNGGNLEAGVLFFPEEPLTWQGDGETTLSRRLPIDLNSTVAVDDLKDGDPYQAPAPAIAPPPVSYLVWRNATLQLPDGAPSDTTVTVRVGSEWLPLPLSMPDPRPTAVLGPSGAEVPILTDGGFILPPPAPKRVEDVLHELAIFPQRPPRERDRDLAPDDAGDEDSPSPENAAANYPLRRAMGLVAKVTEYQGVRTPAEWERWTNRLDELLEAVSEPEVEMIAALRQCGIDPLSALLEPMFQPAGLSAEQRDRLVPVIARIRKCWQLEQCASLVPVKGKTA
jgi:hypothetical protein